MKPDIRRAGGETFRVAWSILAVFALMASVLVVSAPPAAAWPAKITIGGALNVNEKLVSPNGQYNLMMQDNGNLVLRGESEGIIWSPEMDGSGSVKAEITDAGNVVLRQADGDVMWWSGTTRWAASATTLEVTNNGNVLLSNAAGDHLWRVGLDPAIHGVEAMIEFAKAQLGKPYEWAAEGPDSYDCSGLTSKAIRAGGIDIGDHMSTAGQYAYDGFLHYGKESRHRGDLLFWDLSDAQGREGMDHVAIYLGAGRMIHAPYPGASVRIESIYADPVVARPFP
jgi:cell wall-associated NlpC family hydrolase